MVESSQLQHLIGLALVTVIALAAVLLLLRLSAQRVTSGTGTAIGYPPELFPDQELVHSSALAELAATQRRLTAVYAQLPAQSETAIWLRTFLVELRAIMDTAYRVAVITRLYGQPPPLEQLLSEVSQIEAQLIEQVTRRLLAQEGDEERELLAGRLAALRLCARELASLIA